MSPAMRRWITLAILALATVTVSHDLLYLVAHGAGDGYRQAMAQSGHTTYWAGFMTSAAILAAALAGTAARQLRRLSRATVRVRPVASGDASSIRAFARLTLARWRGLLAASAAWLILQENAERLGTGDPLPMLDVVAGDHLLALPIIALVSMAVAAVASLVAWRRDALLARLAAARTWPRHVAAAARPRRLACPHRPDPSTGCGLRAPPLRRLPT